jgi:hypothetical protein
MLRKLTAAAITGLAVAACSVSGASSEDVATAQQELSTCGTSGLEWKPFLARMAYDAADEFGRWEFTTDLYDSGGRLYISSAGLAQCAANGKTGCPAMTAALSAQDGNMEIQNEKGVTIMNPMTVKSQLVNGFVAQQNDEQNQQWLADNTVPAPYNNFQAATRTGLPHTITVTNCAATLYSGTNYSGTATCLRAGNYRQANLGAVGNNNVSSVKVRSGMTVTLYEHDPLYGKSLVLTSSASSLGSFDKLTSGAIVTQSDAGTCSSVDTYQVNGAGANWDKIRGKLVTLGYLRGNDLLNVRIDLANGTIDVDPFNVDFIPPSQTGGASYGALVKSPTAETWRSTEDPSPSIFPVGGPCAKLPYGGTAWMFNGIVKASGSYRYCYVQ